MENYQTRRRNPLVEERGTFVMEVEYLQPQTDGDMGFAQQGA